MSAIRILIVEDNELFATRIEIQLTELGYEITGMTDNSEDALNLVLSEMPDLIIMDINIHGKSDGVSVAEKIKKLKIPVLFITSNKDKDFYERAKQTPYIGYLIKPFDEITLQSAIEFGLKNVQSESEKTEEILQNNHLLVRHRNKLRKLDLTTVSILTSDGNYCNIQTEKEKFIINMSLTKVLNSLPESDFIRIHKKHIVRVDKIENIYLNDGYLEISGRKLPIGRTFKEALMKRFDILS